MNIDMNEQHWMDKKCPPINCRKKQCECGLERVFLSAALGDDSESSPVAPKNGDYCNALVVYEANGNVYFYSQDGVPTLVERSVGDLETIVNRIERNLTKEVADRKKADDDLQQEIDDIKNSPDVVDIVATYADLEAYDTSKLGDNDIVRVLEDESHGGQSTYYRWDKHNEAWTYIGTIGNSEFTVLTDDDANYTDPGTGDEFIALWLLPSGKYMLDDNSTIEMVSRIDDGYPAYGVNATGQPIVIINNGAQAGDLADILLISTDLSFYSLTGFDDGVCQDFRAFSSQFLGTDGDNDGFAGLVPAPTTYDADKFLKSDGSWSTVDSGPDAFTTNEWDALWA